MTICSSPLSAAPPRDRSVATRAAQNAFTAQWLSGLFIGPLERPAVEILRHGAEADFLADLARDLDCARAGHLMQAALRAGSADEVQRTLSIGFTRLFEGIHGIQSAPPYESAYTGTSGRLFQHPVKEMDAILARLGVSVAASCREPADHLSIELAALSSALERNDTAMVEMIRGRLLAWTPDFVGRLGRLAPESFYSAAATLVPAFLSSL